MFRKLALSLCFALSLGLLSACSPGGILHLSDSESKSETQDKKSTEDTKSAEKASSQENLNEPTIGAPVALPPNFGSEEPPKPGETDTAYMPNGLPALQPMKGVNVDELFSEEIRDSDDRFQRLENAVVEMRKEFESVKPSIVRLAATEADIQSLVREMEAMLQETPPEQNALVPPETEATLQVDQLDPQPALPETFHTKPPEQGYGGSDPPSSAVLDPPKVLGQLPKPVSPTGDPQVLASAEGNNKTPNPEADKVLSVPPTPMTKDAEKIASTSTPVAAKPKPAAPPKQTPPPKAAKKYDGVAAMDMRIGEHDDKIRVVLDTNQNTPFTIDLDNEEKLIIVELPEARWVGPTSQKFSDSALLESYSVESTNGGKGSMIVLTLKHQTQILKESILSPDQNPNHRIYFDLKL